MASPMRRATSGRATSPYALVVADPLAAMAASLGGGPARIVLTRSLRNLRCWR